MKTMAMRVADRSGGAPWSWRLDGHEAMTLRPQPLPRWLRVEAGLVWVTARDAGPHDGDDIWLGAGDSLALPAGSAWVVQGWPQARLSLALPAVPTAAPHGRRCAVAIGNNTA